MEDWSDIETAVTQGATGRGSLAKVFGEKVRGIGRGSGGDSGNQSNGFGGGLGASNGFGGGRGASNGFGGGRGASNEFGGGGRGGSGFGSSRQSTDEDGDNEGFGGGRSRGRDSRGGGGGRGSREGDWVCPDTNCKNNNFGFRKNCQKCDTSKPNDGGGGGGSSSNGFGGRSGGGGGSREGDWVCPDSSCGNKNFAFRKNCQKCDSPKPDDGGGRFGGRSGGGGFGGGGSGGGSKGDGDGEKPREAPYIPPAPSEKEEDIFNSAMQKGINFNKYDDIPVEVSGRDQCGFISTFDEGGLYPTFLKNVKKAKYEKPTPIQKYSIPIITAGRDLMACAQTGSGKTAAFLLPVLTSMITKGLTTDKFQEVQTPQVICVAPTRELALQIYNDCRKFAYETEIRAVVLYGGTSVGYQLRQVESGANIVVATPGRLLDVINRGKISLARCSFLILDEADRMLDMGFEPDIRKLVETMGMPAKTERQTLMFSATFPEEIQKLAADFLNDYLFVTVGRVGGANTDVSQNFFEVDRLQKRESLCDILNAGGNEKTLVFVEQKRNADFLASYLCQSGFPTTSIHGDRLQREREEALTDFKSGKAYVLVATSVAARGLDIPGIKHVVNYDLPSSIDEYVHRIGRTGRCGNLGKATSFFNADTDHPMAVNLVRILKEANQPVPDWLADHASGMVAGDTGNIGGKFGGKDIRHGKFGGGRGQSNDSNWASGTGASAADGDDEDWD